MERRNEGRGRIMGGKAREKTFNEAGLTCSGFFGWNQRRSTTHHTATDTFIHTQFRIHARANAPAQCITVNASWPVAHTQIVV